MKKNEKMKFAYHSRLVFHTFVNEKESRRIRLSFVIGKKVTHEFGIRSCAVGAERKIDKNK